MRIRTILTIGLFTAVLIIVAGMVSCSNPDERPTDTWFEMFPKPLPESPIGLVITDPVFRQKEPDPLIEQSYLAAAIKIRTSKDLWNYFTSASKRIDIVGTRITNQDMVARLVSIANRGVPINIVVEKGFFNDAESAPYISQLIQTGRVTIKTDKDDIARQVHSRYAIIDDHIVLASSGDFLDSTFNTSINNTLIFNTPRYYVNGAGASSVKTITDAFLFDFDQMFNMGRFGGYKERLITNKFNIGVDVEIYFGPNDNLLAEIADEISNMQSNMTFMINQVTDLNMLSILANFAYAGYYDFPSNGDLSDILPNATPFAWAGYNSLNHKVMVIDMPTNVNEPIDPVVLDIFDPVVITGSCNWTYNGLKLNDEQLIIVHDLTLGFQFGFPELSAIAREAAGYGVVFGWIRTWKNVPIPEATIECRSLRIPGTPFTGDGGNIPQGESEDRGDYFMLVPSGLVRNIRLLSLGDAEGLYLYPDPLWGDDRPNQGYTLLPGSSFRADFYLKPMPTNTGTGY